MTNFYTRKRWPGSKLKGKSKKIFIATNLWLKFKGLIKSDEPYNEPAPEYVGCLMIKNFTLRLFILQYLAIKWCLAEQTG